jgi:hypothetical protein
MGEPLFQPQIGGNSLFKQWVGGANSVWGQTKPCHPLPKFVSGEWFNSYNGEVCGFFSHLPETIDFGLL